MKALSWREQEAAHLLARCIVAEPETPEVLARVIRRAIELSGVEWDLSLRQGGSGG